MIWGGKNWKKEISFLSPSRQVKGMHKGKWVILWAKCQDSEKNFLKSDFSDEDRERRGHIYRSLPWDQPEREKSHICQTGEKKELSNLPLTLEIGKRKKRSGGTSVEKFVRKREWGKRGCGRTLGKPSRVGDRQTRRSGDLPQTPKQVGLTPLGRARGVPSIHPEVGGPNGFAKLSADRAMRKSYLKRPGTQKGKQRTVHYR